MRPIVGDKDLQQCRAAGVGYIFNDFSHDAPSGVDYNILHTASCRTLAIANMHVEKYFAVDLQHAMNWLNTKRRDNWKRCPICAP
jgi:hypothetical protein